MPTENNERKTRAGRRRGGEARAAQASAQAARRKGGKASGKRNANPEFGARMAAYRRLKRYGPPSSTSQRLDRLESEVSDLKRLMQAHVEEEAIA